MRKTILQFPLAQNDSIFQDQSVCSGHNAFLFTPITSKENQFELLMHSIQFSYGNVK